MAQAASTALPPFWKIIAPAVAPSGINPAPATPARRSVRFMPFLPRWPPLCTGLSAGGAEGSHSRTGCAPLLRGWAEPLVAWRPGAPHLLCCAFAVPDLARRCLRVRGNVRSPDASFVSTGRFPNDRVPDDFATLAPDLAVEVVSPGDRPRHILDKVSEYLEAGTRLVWGN